MIAKKEIKAIKKSQRMADYKAAVDVFFNKAMLVERKNIIFQKNSKSVTGNIISDIVCLLFLLVTCHKGKHLSWQESAAKNSGFHCKCRNNGKFACKQFYKVHNRRSNQQEFLIMRTLHWQHC